MKQHLLKVVVSLTVLLYLSANIMPAYATHDYGYDPCTNGYPGIVAAASSSDDPPVDTCPPSPLRR